MKEFTFVTITYNHQDFIVDHLESIKKLIDNYSKGINVNYVLSDDCSRDQTVSIAKEWLERNDGLFYSTKIIESNINKGTVNNFITAIQAVKTNDFKLLAGDDCYGDFDIFQLMESIENDEILVSPLTAFGPQIDNNSYNTGSFYRVLMYMAQKGNIKELLQIDNYIPAPGVFLKRSIIETTEALDYIKEFKYCEDYPMYYHIIVNKNIKTRISNQSYIYYRVGFGVSNSTNSEKRNEFVEDLNNVREKIGSKAGILPKYINPYKYYLLFLTIKGKLYRRKLPINYMKAPELLQKGEK